MKKALAALLLVATVTVGYTGADNAGQSIRADHWCC